MKIYIKRPSDFTNNEIRLFTDFIKEGSQVSEIGLKKRVLNCKLLGFCYMSNELVGISAIKTPLDSYRFKVFMNARLEKEVEKFKYELGYSFTKKGYQGKGINYAINSELISNVNDSNIYATTGNPGMIHLLVKLGFNQIGEKYNGDFNETLQVFSINKCLI